MIAREAAALLPQLRGMSTLSITTARSILDAAWDHSIPQLSANNLSIACSKGCFWCCRPDPLVTAPEMKPINKRLTKGQKSYIRANAATLANPATCRSLPCPLLTRGRCSVYSVRPLVCRAYHSLEPDPGRCDPSKRTEAGEPWPIAQASTPFAVATALQLELRRRNGVPQFEEIHLGLALVTAVVGGD